MKKERQESIKKKKVESKLISGTESNKNKNNKKHGGLAIDPVLRCTTYMRTSSHPLPIDESWSG